MDATSLVKHLIPDRYRDKLTELFEALDTDQDGFLDHLSVQTLGYVTTGHVPSYHMVLDEMERVRKFYEEIARKNGIMEVMEMARIHSAEGGAERPISLNQFLIFSVHLVKLDYDLFERAIDMYISKLVRIDPKIDRETLQEIKMTFVRNSQQQHDVNEKL